MLFTHLHMLLFFFIFIFSTRFIALLQTAEPGCLKVVVGCKSDCLPTEKRAVRLQECQNLALQLNPGHSDMACTPYFETSSLKGLNVERVFEFIFSHCLPLTGPRADAKRAEIMKLKNSARTVRLEKDGDSPVSVSKCAC